MGKGLSKQVSSIGACNELVAFRSVTYGRDDFSGPTRAADGDPLTQYRAIVMDISGKEAPTANPQDKVTRLIRVEMRTIDDNPTQSMELIWNEEAYDITDIRFTDRQRWMIIEARLKKAGT